MDEFTHGTVGKKSVPCIAPRICRFRESKKAELGAENNNSVRGEHGVFFTREKR